jgi:hypothetical protein
MAAQGLDTSKCQKLNTYIATIEAASHIESTGLVDIEI